MRKNVRLAALGMAAAMVLGACSSGGGSGEANQGSAGGSQSSGGSSGGVELTVWLTPQWKGVFSGTEEGADYDSFLKEAAKRYKETHPDVNIKVEVIDGSTRDENLSVAQQTNTLPDIVFEGAFTMSSFYHKGAIAPITDLITDQDKADISEGIWDNCMIEDEVFIYPFFHMPGTLIYNADMFRKAGLDDKIGGQYEIATWTPDEYVGILEALKEGNPGVYPMALFALNNQADTWNLSYLRMFGNQFYSDDNKLIVNEESGVKALQYILDLYNKGLTVPGAESLDSNTNNAMFQNQQIAVSFTNSVLLSNLAADMESGTLPAFDYRLANIPGDPNPNGFTYVTGAMVMNTGDEARMAAAKEFVKYFCSDEELVVASKNGTPVRSSVVAKVSGELPYLEAYNKNDQYLFNFSKNLPGYTELRNVLFPELQAALTGEKTAQQALDDYVKNGNTILEEARKSSVVYN
ncbi:MAG: sugar ABC transporter substrate-binding protein [Hungatella sp.]|nr:sugar ABC transporter substrate-binding protein [Hungatella sp.]